MQDRQCHLQEVEAFLQKRFLTHDWKLTLPYGSGNETFFATSRQKACFVKIDVQIPRYEALAMLGLTPPILATGSLDDGASILVQPLIAGRKPSRRDFQTHIEQVAKIVQRVHQSSEIQRVLPAAPFDLYSIAGSQALTSLQQRWLRYREQVAPVADFVDESLAYLTEQVQTFSGAGLVASHNDICNANWLLSAHGDLYLIDLESMAMDDPAVDTGALLWWYFPPTLRHRFLLATGYADDESFRHRMHVRMAMHCLEITLPRDHSFDRFEPTAFPQSLTDFKAIMANAENPQGYD
jgi:thiamine kinase-like enzyme